jgi:hypothetical protein
VKVPRRFQATKKPRERGFFANPRQCAGRKRLAERITAARDFLKFFSEARFWERLIRISTPETFAK